MNTPTEQTPVLTRNEVLALDIATLTGYYSAHEGGTWNFNESLTRNGNKQHAAFRNTLMHFIARYGIRRIVAEDVSVNKHFVDTRKLSEFRGILLEVCDTLSLPEPTFVNPRSLKKWATGNGNATKEEMITACRRRWHVFPADDNEADAVHLYYYYLKKFFL